MRLKLDACSEEVVPSHEAEMPTAAELRFHSSGHRAHPSSYFYAWGVRASAVPLLLDKCWYIRHARAELEQESECYAEVPGGELVNHLASGSDRQALHLGRWR